MLSLEITTRCSRKAFQYILAIFSHRILKRHVLKGPGSIKLIIFTSLWTQTLLTEIWGLVLCGCVAVKNKMTANTVWCLASALTHAEVPAVLLTIAFAPIAQMSTQWKKANNVNIIKTVLNPWVSLRFFCF